MSGKLHTEFMDNNAKKKWLLIFLNFIMIISFFFLNNIAERLATHNKHLTYSVSNIKYLTLTSQVLLNNEKADNEKVSKYLEKCLKDLNTLKSGGKVIGFKYDPSNNNRIKEYLDTTIAATKSILSNIKEGKDSAKEYALVLKELNGLDQFVNKRFGAMYQSYKEFRITLFTLIVVVGLLTVYFVRKISIRTEEKLSNIDLKMDQLKELNEKLEQKIDDEGIKSIKQERELFMKKKELFTKSILKEIITKTDTDSNSIEFINEYFRTALMDENKKGSFDMEQFSSKIKGITQNLLEKGAIGVLIDNNIKNENLEIYETKLISVILSLILNAKERLDEKDMEQKEIKISAFSDDKAFIFEITDNTGGMDQNSLKRVFKPRLNMFLTDTNETMDLYMSYDSVKSDLGGELSVENVESGVSFKIVIPFN